MLKSTRREALVTIAAGLSASSLPAQEVYEPQALSAEDYDLLGTLVDMILPATDTPGARDVGVHSMIDEDLAESSDTLRIVRNGLGGLREAGFAAMMPQQRVAKLTAMSESTGSAREFFETVKGLTIDAYYSTEVGLVEELGYQGNTYLAEFPGCTDEHSLEDAD